MSSSSSLMQFFIILKEIYKNIKDPKKNISRNKVGQNMQMLKRMTPEQKYARKMRIEKQKKDKKLF